MDIPLSAVPILSPAIPGHETLSAPCLVFLITHEPSTRALLFDLGIRKDWTNLPPGIPKMVRGHGATVNVQKDVSEILEDEGVDVKGGAVESIIWSHSHWDHTGNPALFPPQTSLIVGPGFKDEFMPGFPTNPESLVLDSDFEGREVKELAFGDLEIGNFRAFDFFGDGSFYILDCPGHMIAHICGLARVTSGDGDDDTFIFMGGDVCHHGGEFRPTEYLPLPSEVTLPSHNHSGMRICPGSLFEKVIPATNPVYHVGALSHDAVKAEEAIRKLEVFDAAENVWVVIAHDPALLEPGTGVELFPASANDWKKQKLDESTRWGFLKDFEIAAKEATTNA